MLLAGGQGSRLHALTSKVAKPALPFGGKYRIIDFPLSNCVNSGIDTVGVLTQYQPLELNSYIGSGQPWDLNRTDGGVSILPPYISEGSSGTWYKGTANAIYQNIGFIELYDPEYVLILSGDHIYKMDYSQMLRRHIKDGADCTISVLEVSPEEACRFGIMNADESGRIFEFEEKPEHPKSNLASMGVYIFKWKKLRQYLMEDEANPVSENDFGKNIIPDMLAKGERLFIYKFSGYWKDVGTIDSFWDANMDMLTRSNLDMFDASWPIFARSPVQPPHHTGQEARVEHSIVTEGCEIDGHVENSVLFHSVSVHPDAHVEYSILMPGAVVEKGAQVSYAIVAERTVIGAGAVVGAPPLDDAEHEWGITTVAAALRIGEGAVIRPGAMISECIPAPKGGRVHV